MFERPVIAALAALAPTLSACERPPAFDPPAGSYRASEATVQGAPAPRTIAQVDSTFFRQNLPFLGRLFVTEDYRGRPVTILHHDFWTDALGGRPEVIGREVEVDGVARTVVGVMPLGVDVPEGVVLWVPEGGA